MSMIAFYNGGSGMRAFQAALDVTSHNIANIQTNGYKAKRATFQDLLYTRINTNVQGNHLVGHGVRMEHVDELMNQAGLDQTMNSLDFAIVGDGFFHVDNKGQREYTRNGAFDLSIENGEPFLVTNDGAYVLDKQGNRIKLTKNTDGTYDTEGLADKLGIFTFPNLWGLEPKPNARYLQSENSGNPIAVNPKDPNAVKKVELLQGALEFSGVDLGNEMIDVIMYQRGFQLNSRVLQTADQIADELNRLR